MSGVFKVIKGRFFVAGYAPDADSIRFRATRPEHWEAFNWKSQKNKLSRLKQLRFEGIDALETHYEESHQPRAVGFAALEVLLRLLGIQELVYNLSLTRIHSAKDRTTGFIASQSLDVFDRPISLVFPQEAALPDGAELTLAQLPLDKCVNVRMTKMGLVYPTFYNGMDSGLLNFFTNLTILSRKELVGLWALDRTNDFTLWNADTISQDVVILPKLFRRLTTFLQDCSDFSQLPAYLQLKGDRVTLRSSGQTMSLGDLLQIDGRRIRCPVPLEELIFDPKD
jgi:hypothetical protein